MTLNEFKALHKIKKDYCSRLKEEINNLKKSVTIIPNNEEEFLDSHCCGKRTYKTEREAMESISRGGKNKKYKPVRAYLCENGNWHLTSIRFNKYRKIQYGKC